MKPAPFEYIAVESWNAALAALTDEAMVLAGGQSLVPLMNQRRVRPARLVDINAIPGVIRRTDGVLRIGATVRQAALERSSLVTGWPRGPWRMQEMLIIGNGRFGLALYDFATHGPERNHATEPRYYTLHPNLLAALWRR